MKNITIPADVPKEKITAYNNNFDKATGGSGNLMLFAGDQKVEHLNKDFYGTGIAPDDANPEHLFKVASTANIGVFATQMGLIARYGNLYNQVPYLVKLNSKTNIVPVDEKAPLSQLWFDVDDVISFRQHSGLNILGIGYTIYLGSEYEHIMLREAAQSIYKAHQQGMIAVLWIYPKGKYIK
ncbi:MAG: aldolase, partial [Xanthomonadaceae bacterium]|nr:aldolase [Xanthomonadaceae bacterium]